MTTEHYFTRRPAGEAELRPLEVRLAGRMRRLTTAGGVFSPGRLDAGTAVLLEHVPAPPATGDLLDLGCGWGPIALQTALASPAATVWAVDVNERALDLVRRNAEALGTPNVRAVRPEEVPEEVRFAQILSNPPIRVGKAVLHGMLADWVPRLAPDATAWLVVQKNLGSDSLQRWLVDELGDGFSVERSTSVKGYRVLRVHRADRAHRTDRVHGEPRGDAG